MIYLYKRSKIRCSVLWARKLRNAAVPIVMKIETLLFLAISLRPANVLEEGNVANEHDFTETMAHSPIMQVCGSFIIWRLILIMEKSTFWQTL